MTATRHRGNAPIALAFRELSHLPPEEKREQLMLRLEEVWDTAKARSYMTKKGEEISSPDTAVMLKVVQAVAVLQGMAGPAAEDEGKRLAAMSDAELVREATKRLPAHEVAALADQLIAQREQELSKREILTTGETTDERHEASREEATQAGGGDSAQSDSEWAG